MFLAVNLNVANAKKRKKEKERVASESVMPDGMPDEMKLEALQPTTSTTTATTTTAHNLTAMTPSKCKNCRHMLASNDSQMCQQRQRLSLTDEVALCDSSRIPLTPCNCDCACINKVQVCCSGGKRRPLPPTTPPPSLFTVYMCLGILTLALATLSVLFYSHASSMEASGYVHDFQAQFRRELAASEQVLRSMVTQFLQQQKQLERNANRTTRNLHFPR